jgi:hypothetical protein
MSQKKVEHRILNTFVQDKKQQDKQDYYNPAHPAACDPAYPVVFCRVQRVYN